MADSMAGRLIGVGVSIFVIQIVFTAVGLNTGLYSTLLTQILPIIAIVAGVAYIVLYTNSF